MSSCEHDSKVFGRWDDGLRQVSPDIGPVHRGGERGADDCTKKALQPRSCDGIFPELEIGPGESFLHARSRAGQDGTHGLEAARMDVEYGGGEQAFLAPVKEHDEGRVNAGVGSNAADGRPVVAITREA